MSNQQNLAAIERAVSCFNSPSDRDRYFDLYSNDVVLHGFPPGLPAGVAGAKAFFGAFWEAFPDAKLRGDDVVASDDGQRVAIRYTIEGTHRAPFAGVATTGKKVTLTGQTILRFSNDGKCAERWNAADMLGLMQQLGAVPS